jgi:hypothetical protein
MTARTLDIERLKTQLQLWDAEIAHLEEEVGRMQPEGRSAMQNEARDTLQAMLAKESAALRQQWAEAEQALEQVEQARDDEWHIAWEHAERLLDRLGATFEQARARFGE